LEDAERLLRRISCGSCYLVCYTLNVVAVELPHLVIMSVYLLPPFIFNPTEVKCRKFRPLKKIAKSDNLGHLLTIYLNYIVSKH
jgi:hypothetical protein